jgi:ABC-type nitrate/sulfonate/bicarbonate transport system permease component
VTAWVVRASHLVLIAILTGLWEAASRFGWVDPNLLPPLSQIFGVLA